MLHTKHDCLLYVVSQTNKKAKDAMTHNSAINNLAKIVEDIWNKADCCPFTQKHISKLFEQEVWKPYLYLQHEKHLPGGGTAGLKRSHKKDPTKVKQRLVGFKYIIVQFISQSCRKLKFELFCITMLNCFKQPCT